MTVEVFKSSLTKVSDHLFEEAEAEKKKNGSVSDETLKSLSFIHGPYFLSALDLVDRNSVCRVTSTSGNTLYQVKSSVGHNVYNCHLLPGPVCSCPCFSFGAVSKEDAIFCKHLLAVKMAVALGTARHETMSDEAFRELNEDSTETS